MEEDKVLQNRIPRLDGSQLAIGGEYEQCYS